MGLKHVFLGFLLVSLALNVISQACIGENEEEIELSHTTDGSLYFVSVDKDFSFRNTVNAVSTYEKGTTKLILKPSSYTTKTTTDPKKNFVIPFLAEYNDETRYTKLTEVTQTAVGTLTAYYLEYEDKSASEKGRVTVIIGERFEEKTKVYSINLRAKTARFESEKEAYIKTLGTFSLDPLDECQVEPLVEPPVEQPADTPVDDGTDSNDGPADDVLTPPDNSSSNPPDDGSLQNQGNQNNEPPQDAPEGFTIFGFDWVIVAAVLIILFLIIAIGFIGFVIIAVIVYFFFIRKK